MPAQSPEHAVSDEVAAYIADALMQLALEFEETHFDQIRRHYQSLTPTADDDPRQLDLFDRYPLPERQQPIAQASYDDV
jgi:hypothetical protein